MKEGMILRRKVEGIRNTQNELVETQKTQCLKSATEHILKTKLVAWRPGAGTSQNATRRGRSGRGGAQLQELWDKAKELNIYLTGT